MNKNDEVTIAQKIKAGKLPSFCSSANNGELVERLEGVVSVWTNQISQVLTESEQMRKEADDVGPAAELEYWKRRMTTFNRSTHTHTHTHTHTRTHTHTHACTHIHTHTLTQVYPWNQIIKSAKICITKICITNKIFKSAV